MKITGRTVVTMNSRNNDLKNEIDNLFSIDYHAHVLPGCDHGSKNLETSLAQLEMAKQAGVKVICATPHFYPHKENVDAFLKRRNECFELLSGNLKQDMPKVIQSAEVLMCEGIEHLENIEELCLENSNELLFEMPFYAEWPEELVESVLNLQGERSDLNFIMAHADRYSIKQVETFIREGIKLQLNIDALAHPVKNKHLKKWIEEGLVVRVGSDIHQKDNTYKYWDKGRKVFYKSSK